MSVHSSSSSEASRCDLVVQRNATSTSTRTPLSDDDIVATMAYKILMQFKTPKDIRISVKGEYWERLPELRGQRLEGTIMQWAKKEGPDRKLKVLWPDGHDIEHLDMLLHPEVDLQFLRYANGKPAPQLSGRAAAREARDREASQAAAPQEKIVVEYVDGGEPKKQVWTVERPEGITVDQRTEDWVEPVINRKEALLKTPYKMWVNATLPIGIVTQLVRFFNQRLDGSNDSYAYRKTTAGEVIQFFGYMGALAVERGLPIEDMWRPVRLQKDIRAPPSFGEHGMSKNRFERLRSLAGHPYDLADEQQNKTARAGADPSKDAWRWCRMCIDEFNAHYSEVFQPGSLTGPDESMSPYEGEEGPHPHQIPHKHFVPRKPKDTGAELNTQADGQCGGIYSIDIERGASDPHPREFEAEWGYTSALNFRLAKSILHSNRIFAGDSRFMSVDAVEDLHLKGLYAIGDVKTKSSRYPIHKIKELCGPEPGDWCVMSTTLDDGFKVFAIGHRRGGEVHTFVSSCGVTIAGKPQEHREDLAAYGEVKPRKCPQVLNWWSMQQPKIDKNNRFRQHILGIEERFVTQSFPFRLLTTVLGITFANAFEWYSYFCSKEKKYSDFLAFMVELSFDAMHNNYDSLHLPRAVPQTPGRAPTTASQSCRSPLMCSPRLIAKKHHLMKLKALPGYRGSEKQLCAICQDNNHKTSWCCAECSTPDLVFAVHPTSVTYGKATVTYDCLSIHHSDPSRDEHRNRMCAPTGRRAGRASNKRRRRPASDDEDD